MPNDTEALVAYVPVIHKGYTELFAKHREADMHVLDQDVLDVFSYLRKDIRALSPQQSMELIEAMRIFPAVKLLGKSALNGVAESYDRVVMPNDDISRQLAEEYFGDKSEFEPIFLRWDRENSVVDVDVEPDRTVKANDFEEKIIGLMYKEAERGTSWWRRVGSAIVKDGEVIMSDHNRNMPTDYTSSIDGDPRSAQKRGVGIEHTNDVHAEARMIAISARHGTALEGASMYVETFPCPKCAKDIANAGIKDVYYVSGYAITDALGILKASEVEIIRIETKQQPIKGREFVPYPGKKP